MSTNASVAKVYKDGSVKEITVHYDGYIEGVGTTLEHDYQSPKKIDALLKLGEISSLGKYVEVAPCLAQYGTKAFEMASEISRTSADTYQQIREHTMAYHRDRGEDLSFYEHDNLQAYYDSIAEDIFLEYCYINIDNEWYVKTIIDDEGHKSELQLLSDLVKETN